jgi:hypothetical protein
MHGTDKEDKGLMILVQRGWRAGLVDVNKIYGGLVDVAEGFLEIATLPGYESLASKHVIEVADRIFGSAKSFYELEDVALVPLFNKVFDRLFDTAYHLKRFVDEVAIICDRVRRRKIAVINPCLVHTVDSVVEDAVRDFAIVGEQVLGILSEVEEMGGAFLDSLEKLSSACITYLGENCLRHATPDQVSPASLRDYAKDLLTAIGLMRAKFLGMYRGIRRSKLGSIRFYEHPGTTGELSGLARRIAGILNKQLETFGRSLWLEKATSVYALRDMVVAGFWEAGDIVVKPRWIADFYLTLEEDRDVMRRLFDERGFKTEPVERVVGFRVTMPPGDVREAVKLASILPIAHLANLAKRDTEEAYKATKSMLELLEARLEE